LIIYWRHFRILIGWWEGRSFGLPLWSIVDILGDDEKRQNCVDFTCV
jgi:hypothetical protein